MREESSSYCSCEYLSKRSKAPFSVQSDSQEVMSDDDEEITGEDGGRGVEGGNSCIRL